MTSTDNDLASPASDAIVRNPYRVLGLPGDATWAEIRSAADRLLEDPEPEKQTTPWDLAWLGPPPRRPADVERALARLADSRRRLPDRLFWFHERFAESAVSELTPATIRNAMEGWSATSQPVARHDAAVVALIAAIALDPRVEKSEIWQRALEEWEEVLQQEPYWIEVLRLEMEGGFENPASLAELREIREQGLHLVSEPLLAHAREAVIAEDLPRAARTLTVLREVLSEEEFSTHCSELAEHVWDGFDEAWSPDASAKPQAPTDDPAPREPSFDTQNPALWDFAAEEAGKPVEPVIEPRQREAGSRGPGPERPATPKPPRAPEPPRATEPPRALEPEEGEAAPVRPAPPSDGDVRGDDPADAVSTTEPDRSAEETDTAVTEVPPVADSDPPTPAPADRASTEEPARPIREAGARGGAPRFGTPSLLAAAVAFLVVVTAAALVPRFRSSTEAGASPPDSILRGIVEGRMETIDAALAEALVDRTEIDEDVDLLRESVEGYQTLVEDYERRMARQLPADRGAYRRVVGLREEAWARLDSVLFDRRALQERIGRLERIGSDLIAEWNAVGRSGSETERLPSP